MRTCSAIAFSVVLLNRVCIFTITSQQKTTTQQAICPEVTCPKEQWKELMKEGIILKTIKTLRKNDGQKVKYIEAL
jgi:hypothetical protein